MIRQILLSILALILLPAPALAQPLFGNPFADASVYRTERGSLPPATYRVIYEALTTAGPQQHSSELIIDVGPDWAVARQNGRTTLYDFRLNRVFTIGSGTFTSMNGLGDLAFRVMERQNRTYLQRVMSSQGADSTAGDACDAESELGLAIPGAPDAGITTWREGAGALTLRCAGRDIGVVTPGSGAAAPPALWPTLFAEMRSHPALLRRARETGRAPERLENAFRATPGGETRRAWRLVRVEEVRTAYPLEIDLRNTTADVIDRLVPGAGALGADAVAGRAQGGAPTLASWDANLRSLAQRDGDAAAAMLVGVGLNMFPEIQCSPSQPLFVCDLIRGIRTMDDPAPWAVIEIGLAEQGNNVDDAIAAMQRAQASPQRDHPALGAAFALAVLRFDERAMRQAQAAGLPTNVDRLQNLALLALPYNPAYWTDVGDRFGRAYEWPSAMLFFDVAHALPMPSAVARNSALTRIRTFVERLRRDFPDATLAGL